MCTSIDGEPIYNADVPADQPFCQVNTEELVAGEHYIAKVAAMYSTGMSQWTECEWQYIPCENYTGTVNGVTYSNDSVLWDYPGGGVNPQPGPGSTFSVNFDDSQMPAGWTTIDANNDGYNWVLGSQIGGVYLVSGASLQGSGHNSSNDLICSGSYSNATGAAITPDNYLVSPQVTLAAGSTFSFWACAQDASYAAEHYGVFVSDNGTSDWTMVQEWTMTAKGEGMTSIGRNGEMRAQGNWYNKTVDLSSFAGQKYIAIRHFNCNDQFILDVDDIELTAAGKGNRAEWTFANGFVTDPGAMNNGGDASWIKGSQSTYGPGCQMANGNRVGDSFTIDAATTIDEITVYGYQTGSSTNSTFNGLYVQIYDGNPMSGGTVVWGDANANIMTATAFTNCYRGSDGDASGTTRPIMSITASGLSIELEAGTYWLVYQLNGTGSSGPWGQPHAEPGIGNTGNGIQWLGSNSAWQNLTDSGSGTGYGVAMTLHGNQGGTPGPQPSGDVIGAMIFADGEWEAFVPYPTNYYVYEGEAEQVCVRIVYNGTNTLPEGNIYYSMSCPECVETTEGCAPVENLTGTIEYHETYGPGVLLTWEGEANSYTVSIGTQSFSTTETSMFLYGITSAGNYTFNVVAVYDDCESDPETVTVTYDDVIEVEDNVSLYPNPTTDNVTIEAEGMSRITVVTLLGQVVYDTEVSEDKVVLNMSQFNAGMYMVRVHTASGVTVKRVTVMQ